MDILTNVSCYPFNNLLMFKDTEFQEHIISSSNSFLYLINLSTECFPLAYSIIILILI